MRALKNCKTVAKAINSGTPSLSSLVRTMGDKKVEAYIKIWLIDLNETLGLKTPLKEHQIDTIAFYIVDKYRNLNIADINLIFNIVKLGEYKGVYDRVTIPTVMGWFKQYFDDRCNTAAEQSYQNHVQHKTAFSDVSRSSETTMRDQMANLKANYEKEKSLEETKKRIAKAQKKYNKENSKK